jgi:hypothetical protein
VSNRVGPFYPQDSTYYRTHDQLVRDFEEHYDTELPTHREVCPSCDGKGTHVNRSIDGNGITAEDLEELGDGFLDDYRGGVYDVVCDECHGRNVVEVVNETDLMPDTLRLWREWLRDTADAVATQLAELRAGA